VVSRTGYYEREVADYGLNNLKGDAMLKWKNNRGAEVAYVFRASKMDNIYQRSNRFRLENYWIQQHALQIRTSDIKINVYLNGENTGDSYNLRSMAENLERTTLSDAQWFAAYASAYQTANTGSVSIAELHKLARFAADKNRPAPGTVAFKNSLKRLQQINNWDSGAALKVQAAFMQADLQWDATEKLLSKFRKNTGLELLTGVDFRQYITQPDGNYFINPEKGKDGMPLLYKKAGLFLSAHRNFFQQTLKVGMAVRTDKNDYFRTYFSPRITTVWRPSLRTTIRANFQLGYRFPIIFEAFSNVNSGGVKRVGGLPVMSSGIFENGWLQTSISSFQAAVLRDMNGSGIPLSEALQRNKILLKRNPYTYLKPEKVRSMEIGFRQQLMQGRLMIDADAYLNHYNAFIAQVNITVTQSGPADSMVNYLYDRSKQKPYRMWTNSTSIVQNYGYSVGVNFVQPGSFMFNGQLSFTKLYKKEGQDGLEDGFNTPSWSSSFSFSTNELMNRWKMGATWRWQDSYEWISFLVSGSVPAYQTIDAFISYDLKKQPLVVKMGGTNILNQYYRSLLGGPSVGGFYYLSLTFGQ
jgi:iron complex outermembrane receptor protein